MPEPSGTVETGSWTRDDPQGSSYVLQSALPLRSCHPKAHPCEATGAQGIVFQRHKKSVEAAPFHSCASSARLLGRLGLCLPAPGLGQPSVCRWVQGAGGFPPPRASLLVRGTRAERLLGGSLRNWWSQEGLPEGQERLNSFTRCLALVF